MRVIFDTNIFISYLISPANPERTMVRLIDAAVAGAFTLLLPVDLVTELQETIAEHNHLARMISPAQVDSFLSILRPRTESVQSVPVPQPRVTRDPEDDYLLAAAAIANADVLVTGDRDLLDIRGLLKRTAIMTAAEFLKLIASMESPQP